MHPRRAARLARSRSSREARFARYVDDFIQVIGRADRAAPVRTYCTGMLLTLERKRVGPMAAATAPAQVLAKHQSMLRQNAIDTQ